MLTTEELQAIVARNKDRWASLSDLKLPEDLENTFYEAASIICYDAVNIVLEHHSTTSGMYGSWHLSISNECTVYVDRCAMLNTITGKTIEDAVAKFILRVRELSAQEGWE